MELRYLRGTFCFCSLRFCLSIIANLWKYLTQREYIASSDDVLEGIGLKISV